MLQHPARTRKAKARPCRFRLHLTCSCFVLYPSHPRSFEGIYLGDSVGGAGSGACASGLINRTLGAPRASTLRALRPVCREPAEPSVRRSHRPTSAARACGARLHGNHRGEAPQGAPARVMGRQSLPLKGLAQPQGGHRVRRFPRQRFAALHSPRLLSRRTGRTAAGCRAFPGALTLACRLFEK